MLLTSTMSSFLYHARSSFFTIYAVDNPDPGRTIYFHFPHMERVYEWNVLESGKRNDELLSEKTYEAVKEYVRARTTTL